MIGRALRVALVATAVAARLRAASALDTAAAERFAGLALSCVDREFPNKPEHVLESADDARVPKQFHPAFFGCYDWHSSVHGHWLLLRLLATHPEIASAARAREILDAHFTPDAIAAETRYLDQKANRAFERPYGWAWALRLAGDLAVQSEADPRARAWREHFRPLEDGLVDRYVAYLPKLTHPIRTGVHPNTAFALALALDYARAAGRKDFERVLLSRSHFYYGEDRACPLAYEPSGEDFLSPCLAEADLMRRVLAPREYARWLHGFLPQLSKAKALRLAPAVVTDPTDPKLVHLDGLNLSRAWMLRGIASGLPPKDARRAILQKAADAHAAAGLARVSSGNYEGEHWLASFATYLLTE
ncbi:MAG TPA: DUF2891 domain-containing protein [Thermoanaerobaculia bacterium]